MDEDCVVASLRRDKLVGSVSFYIFNRSFKISIIILFGNIWEKFEKFQTGRLESLNIKLHIVNK